MEQDMLLEISNLRKNFGAVQALKDASFSLRKGEAKALLGSNGSGKSTLVKILSGLNKKDGGKILLHGKEIEIASPAESIRYGLAMAYQDLSLIPELSVAENMVLGSEPGKKRGKIDTAVMYDYAEQMIAELGIEAFPNTILGEVDLSNQGLIEVAKAVYTEPEILMLDEITASMHQNQVEQLFHYLNKKREQGLAVLFVSHRFEEVYRFCESAAILRGGVSVKELSLEENDQEQLVYYMTGKSGTRAMAENRREMDREPLEARLRVNGVKVGSQVKGVDLFVQKGEIIGIAGLQGQGQSEFLRALYGAVPITDGTVELDGTRLVLKSPKDAVRKGIGFISGDREKEGVFAIRSVSENIHIIHHAVKSLGRFCSSRQEKEETGNMIEKLNIVAAGPNVPAKSLSGGNQQKLIVGRWLTEEIKVLLLDDPTKGVDVHAREEINQIFTQMTSRGTAIIYVSSDNDELMKVADRIYVFYEGRIIEELNRDKITGERLASAVLGSRMEGRHEE